MTSRTWVYTLNNYNDEEIAKLKLLSTRRHRCCAEISAGDPPTPHLQGAITFMRSYRLSQLSKLFPRAHWEIAKVSDPENYCIKGEILINVQQSEQGKRSDINGLVADLKRRVPDSELVESHPGLVLRYPRGIAAITSALRAPSDKWFNTTVEVYWGPPGSGKSRKCREIDPDLYSVHPCTEGATVWFDGYCYEPTILFDDYYGGIRYEFLLQLLDGYPMRVQVKGGFVQRAWTRVLFTSNRPPTMWYGGPSEALMRRITAVHELH